MPALRGRLASRLGWGVADQAVSSLTNFAVGLVVARTLGPVEFGIFALAWVTYAVALNISRGTTTDPLVVRHSGAPDAAWRLAVGRTSGTALLVGIGCGVVVALAGALIGGPTGAAFVVLGAILPGVLLQDSWRYAFFAAGQGHKAALNDCVWALALVPALLVAARIDTVVAFLLGWGAAGACAAVAGGLQARIVPRPAQVGAWLRAQRDLAPRYVVENMSLSGATQLRAYGLGAIAGLAAVGAVRGAELLVGPFYTLLMGIGLFAVPESARILREAPQRLFRFCALVGCGQAGAALLWGTALLVLLTPTGIGPWLLGEVWPAASVLIVPATLAVMGTGIQTGASAGLRALGDSRRSLRCQLIGAAAYLVGGLAGAAAGGAPGSAWGVAVAALSGAVLWWWQLRVGLNAHLDRPSATSTRPPADPATEPPTEPPTEPATEPATGQEPTSVPPAPRLTIGLPVYNGQEYLAGALDALLAQTFVDFELVISDNASTDATAEICRRYALADRRVRYVRQPRNIGAAGNHNVVVHMARGELFKWAAHDDLYEPTLLQRCVEQLDAHPEVVLVSSRSATIDTNGTVTASGTPVPEGSDSPSAAVRFRGMLFALGGDDDYGVIRTAVLRRTPLTGSYYHSDRTLTAELALHGPFLRVPAALYYRRRHSNQAGGSHQTIRQWCVTHDPRRADRLRHPVVRLLLEYVLAFVTAIHRAPLPAAERRRCYLALAGYLVDRAGIRRIRSQRRQRIGLFGQLGSGNLGNDGSFEALLGLLRAGHPDAELSCLCAGPEQVEARYGVPATPLHLFRTEHVSAATLPGIARKAAGKVLDAARILAWVRRRDLVVVPGMGVLEASLPLRPWGFPLTLLCLSAAGRAVGTKVALVGVGADVVADRATRWVLTRAAALATYRSYRDDLSRSAMREMGLDVSEDAVHPDLAFALPDPQSPAMAHTGTVGVGVMAYYGGGADRANAAQIHRSYVGALTTFVGAVAASGRPVHLFVGDAKDVAVAETIIAAVADERVALAAASTLPELMARMAAVDTVVATRYHNVLCALKLGKPTISVGYAAKNDVLMAEAGLGAFCQRAGSVDPALLLTQLAAIEADREAVVGRLAAANAARRRGLAAQVDELAGLVASIG